MDAPPMNIDDTSFVLGLLAGFFVAGVIGQLLNRINKARNAMAEPDRPMKVATANTPRGVMASAARAGQSCLLWSLALLLFVAIMTVLLIALLYS